MLGRQPEGEVRLYHCNLNSASFSVFLCEVGLRVIMEIKCHIQKEVCKSEPYILSRLLAPQTTGKESGILDAFISHFVYLYFLSFS